MNECGIIKIIILLLLFSVHQLITSTRVLVAQLLRSQQNIAGVKPLVTRRSNFVRNKWKMPSSCPVELQLLIIASTTSSTSDVVVLLASTSSTSSSILIMTFS
jgi:hypothetical protein